MFTHSPSSRAMGWYTTEWVVLLQEILPSRCDANSPWRLAKPEPLWCFFMKVYPTHSTHIQSLCIYAGTSTFAYVYICIFVHNHVWTNTDTCACAAVPMHAEAWGCSWVSPSITVHLTCWVRVSAESQIWVVYLVTLLEKSLSLPPKCWNFRLPTILTQNLQVLDT